MRAQICFFVSIVFGFVAWGAVTGSLILPELRRRGRNEALRPLLMFPKPGPDKTPRLKASFVTAVAGLGCGVGYYK